ncbi:hypothetical protein [Streptomyces sp. Tue6028]|uniref:hypothetical protein n=1 Tax=Streptomyces sp. Tue6028 TaxID=2036037 RepID=UPI003D70867F
MEKAPVDQGFKNAVVAYRETVDIEVEIGERNPAQTGFVPILKRWIVERAYGILMLHCRKDVHRFTRRSQIYFPRQTATRCWAPA